MLISDRPRQYVFSGFRNYSVNELVDLINESESNPFPYFRARFFFHKLISLNDKFGKEPLGKEMNAFLSKSKEMTIHQIFLESKK